jgi:diadenosine tetraphosphate (Ap4A) HIT family hydrolase
MLPKPYKSAIIYQDKKLYACLANFPIATGHTVVVWKNKVADLHLLSKKDYLYLMNVVDKVRTAMLKTLKVKKVYLVYMDEENQVHWHLVPRYTKKGYAVFTKPAKRLKNFKLDDRIRRNLII